MVDRLHLRPLVAAFARREARAAANPYAPGTFRAFIQVNLLPRPR